MYKRPDINEIYLKFLKFSEEIDYWDKKNWFF